MAAKSALVQVGIVLITASWPAAQLPAAPAEPRELVVLWPPGEFGVILPYPPQLAVSVATDQQTYLPGEYVRFGVTAHNPSDSDVTLLFNTTLQSTYSIDGVGARQIAGQAFTRQTVPAMGSYTWQMCVSHYEFDLQPGRHVLVGEVIGPGTGDPVEFEILPRPAWPEQFLIDFDAEGAPPLARMGDVPTWRDFQVFDGMGIHFAHWFDEGRKEPLYHHWDDDGHGFLHAGSCGYPPGFNIVADFDEPVFAVRADVSSAAGVTITMLAKRADGGVIASVTSAPLPEPYAFAETLSLTSTEPIASVEWWPSTQNSSVGIDNLLIATAPGVALLPEPTVALFLAALAAPLLGTRRRRQ